MTKTQKTIVRNIANMAAEAVSVAKFALNRERKGEGHAGSWHNHSAQAIALCRAAKVAAGTLDPQDYIMTPISFSNAIVYGSKVYGGE